MRHLQHRLQYYRYQTASVLTSSNALHFEVHIWLLSTLFGWQVLKTKVPVSWRFQGYDRVAGVGEVKE